MSNSAPRKRRNVEGPLASAAKQRGGAKARRATRADRRAGADVGGPRSGITGPRAAPSPVVAETIDVMDNPEEDSSAEVVDLTSETSEAGHVVDLTNDTVLLLSDHDGDGRNSPGGSYVVSSDEDEPSNVGANVLSSLRARSTTRFTPGIISCPVCMDSYSEMVDSGRLVVSTKCGHVFCSQCLRDALSHSHTCPTCRKRLTPRQYHPLYI
ncbi:RING finger protein 4 [Corythoichthys intestinalis]|uniref:RING finger protein 4 n=1 Tax=Corythoichthys intestinalis TaxID=161448 RepID=UPI0025A55E4B|nr:RING finger protein 4 [Corythoichthys intestinalis]